jgi:hypothetical protein
MYAVNATGTLRIDRDGELEGIDIVEHGLTAYHMEFGQGMGYTSPPGAGDFAASIASSAGSGSEEESS